MINNKKFSTNDLMEAVENNLLLNGENGMLFKVCAFTTGDPLPHILTRDNIKEHAINGWAMYFGKNEIYEVYPLEQAQEYRYQIKSLQKKVNELTLRNKEQKSMLNNQIISSFVLGAATMFIGYLLLNLLFG